MLEVAKIVAEDPAIRGKALKGQYKLEVPKSNEISKKLDEFKKLAEKYDVEIIFETE